MNLPGSAGRFSILPHHAALISSLGVGDIVYTTEDGENGLVSIPDLLKLRKTRFLYVLKSHCF